MPSTAETLAGLPLFAGLTDEALKALTSDSPNRSRSYDKGEMIAMQGERIKSLPLLLSGEVRAQMTSPEGKRLTVDIIAAPELLASAFVYSSESRYPVTIEAVEVSEIWHLDKEYFLRFMSQEPVLMRAFLTSVSDRCHFLSQKLNALSLQSLRERLLKHLRERNDWGKQEELALLLGVARPSLARLLGELVEEGVLIKEGHLYKLP